MTIVYLVVGLIGGYCVRILHCRYRDARKAGKTVMQSLAAMVGGGGGPSEPS
jgi:hypothetical protein